MRMGKHRYTFSTEWQNCKIGPYHTSEKQEITEKKNNNNEHSLSHSHKLAEDIVKKTRWESSRIKLSENAK